MLLAKGFIIRSTSPSQVPITIAAKDGGTDFRFCVDYRAVNAQTISDATPPPNIQMVFDQLQGATVFTKIDLRTAYWQVQVKPSDRWKTAFTCRYGHFEWTVMPFGLKNAPAIFVRHTIRDISLTYTYEDEDLIGMTTYNVTLRNQL
jgi:hypothetical protein